jgi:GT2 family glycosyltransferase
MSAQNTSIAVNVVRYNQPLALIRQCLLSVVAQDAENYSITLTENGSSDSVQAEVLSLFGTNPRFSFVDNGANLGFAAAHNRFFAQADADLVMPLNPDTMLTPGYLRTLAEAFTDPTVGAATGKMLKFASSTDGSRILDGTGIVVSRSRRGRERGQHQLDTLQFDHSRRVFGVSGTAPAYRKSALDAVRLFDHEYFDEDFFAYWEDLDLSWRLRLAGYECIYVPEAVVYHERAIGQSKGGYHQPLKFIKHHRQFPVRILRWNWRNQLFCIFKNDCGWNLLRDAPFIVGRQMLMLCYIALFEPRTLGAIPELLRGLPKMIRKRRLIQRMRVASATQIRKWFTEK